jgi:tetratricopeptide (TPR) repeat protein
LYRGQDIPSDTIPQRYFDFLRGGPPEPIAEVFHHNRMDLRGLALLALRLNEILADPEKCACGAGELFGISRLLQRRGQRNLAGRIYRMALDGGLPKAAEQAARRELALLAKRGRDYELSNALWEKLLDDSAGGLKAYEQLAIYYEHQADLPQKAAELTREALLRLQDAFHAGRISSARYQQWHASFQHRLTRLNAKNARSSFPV